jgi:hypothetical protein
MQKNDPARRLIRYLSSIQFGVRILVLILLYACLASALPQLRGAVEMTEMQIFRHWVFAVLVGVFCFSLVLATIMRIPTSIVNAGVWTVHLGLLLLAGGAALYFATKIEGDALLISHSIQIVGTAGGQPRPIASLLAEPGESWSTVMPAFGGSIDLQVTDVTRDASGIPERARITATVGQATRQLNVTVDDDAPLVDDRLVARLAPSEPVTTFFDRDVAALYVSKVGDATPTVLPIDTLPHYRERYVAGDEKIADAVGRAVPSNRTRPEVEFWGIRIPTTWFEAWRMPIDVPSDDLPFDVRVTGYLPYISRMESAFVESAEGPLNPAAAIRLSVASSNIDESLFALEPARSMMRQGVPVEFRWLEDDAAMQDHLQPLAGPHELRIEVKDPPVRRTVAIAPGQEIAVDGTPYVLKIRELQPTWPLMTPGFEGASSPMASVDVTAGDLSYNRTVIQRFPELSQDIDESGVRHREGPYDPNLLLKYRTSSSGWVSLVAGPGRTPRLAVFDATGQVDVQPLEVGSPRRAVVLGTPLEVSVTSYKERSELVSVPIVEPVSRRRPIVDPWQMSAIRLEFTPKSGGDAPTMTRWCRFSKYSHVETQPIRVALTGGGGEFEIIFSRLQRPLDATLIPHKLSVTFLPGRQSVESWRSDFLVATDDDEPVAASVQTNETHAVGRWTLFQSGAAPDHWSFTILGVGNRRGIVAMVIGCVLITLGSLFAFYVKPILIRRGQAALLAMANLDGAPAGAIGKSPDISLIGQGAH